MFVGLCCIGDYVIIYSGTACFFLYNPRVITGSRSAGGSVSYFMGQTVFHWSARFEASAESMSEPAIWPFRP